MYARSPTATHGEPVFPSAGKSEARVDEINKHTQSYAIPTPRFAGNVSTWNLPLMQKELVRRIMSLNHQGIRSQNCISIKSLFLRHFSVGRRVSKKKYVHVLITPRKLCVGSQKCRSSIRWSILCHRDQFENIDFRIFEMVDAKIASSLKKIIQNSNFKKKVNLTKQKVQPDD